MRLKLTVFGPLAVAIYAGQKPQKRWARWKRLQTGFLPQAWRALSQVLHHRY
jgi:hypothetical protein